ncbi:MAG TPA: NUDIX hydrolase [bacterium]|nr:NUDIX hydrolase [bacterium]
MWRQLGARLWSRLPAWARNALVWRLNAHFVIGAVAVVRDDRGHVLIARHTYRRKRPWGLPGGWIQRGEDPAHTVVREVFEETGLRIRTVGPLTVQREGPHHLTVVYAARIEGGTFRPSDEVVEVRYILPGEWPEGLREDHRALILASIGHPAFDERPRGPAGPDSS